MVELEEEISSGAQARRWVFTINNPFFKDMEEIDISKTDLPIKEDYYSADVIKELEESNCYEFRYIKIIKRNADFTTEEFVAKRPFFKDVDSVQRYIENLEAFKYCIFQIEKGEKEETEHIQGFIIYKGSKRFRTVKKEFPFAHLEKCKGSNVECRTYCSKKDTRVEGPFEFGEFAEQRERTDKKHFVEMVQAGMSNYELSQIDPQQFLANIDKIDKIYAAMFEKYAYTLRSVDVTFIYGMPGLGKSQSVRRKIGFKKSFWVNNYDNSMFTNYRFQDTLVLDEFTDKLDIQHLNRMLDVGPYEMRGLHKTVYGAFHHVYLISNYSPKELYRTLQQSSPRIYQAFNRRIHRVLRFVSEDKYIVERDAEWEECTNEIDKEQGLTQQVKRVWELDSYGNKVTLFDRYKGVPELQEVKNVEVPFKAEIVQEELGF